MKQILYFSITLLLLISCKKEEVNSDEVLVPNKPNDKCIEYRITYVENVDAPSIGNVNTPIEIDVSYTLTSGCGNFERFIENINGNTNTIQLETKYEGCTCTMIAPIVTTPFVFEKDTPGIYTFKFKSGASDYIEVDVEIN